MPLPIGQQVTPSLDPGSDDTAVYEEPTLYEASYFSSQTFGLERSHRGISVEEDIEGTRCWSLCILRSVHSGAYCTDANERHLRRGEAGFLCEPFSRGSRSGW